MNLGDLIAILFVVVLLFILWTHGYAGLIAASWVPSRKKDYPRIIEAIGSREKGLLRMADLGCGGGGVMRAVARAYPHAHIVGYEISVPVWLIVKCLNGVMGLGRRCDIRMKNFYKEDLSAYDVIYCFLTPMAMRKLKDKFARELKPGTVVLSYAFSIPGWQGEVIKTNPRQVAIYRYIVSSN